MNVVKERKKERKKERRGKRNVVNRQKEHENMLTVSKEEGKEKKECGKKLNI